MASEYDEAIAETDAFLKKSKSIILGKNEEENKEAKVTVKNTPKEYLILIRVLMVLNKLGLFIDRIYYMLVWNLLTEQLETVQVFDMMLSKMVPNDKIPSDVKQLIQKSYSKAKTAFEKDQSAQLTAVKISAADEKEQPLDASLDEGFWENSLSELKALLRPFGIYGEEKDFQSEMKGLVVLYRRPVGDISQKHRGMMGILAYLSNYSDAVRQQYKDLCTVFCFNEGNSSPEIFDCPEDGVSIQMMEMSHDRFKDSLPSLNTEIVKGNKIISAVLKGEFGEGLLKEVENRMHVRPAFFGKTEISDSRIFSAESSHLNLPLGMLSEGNSFLFFNNEKSLISLAGPGSGKTQCHVLPALMQYKGAAIVLDIKGECLENTAAWRHENVGPVMAFMPATPEESDRYNPLSFISQDPDQVWEDARLLAEMLVVPQSKNDPTWETQGRQLLTLLISYVAYMPDNQRNMATILDLISDLGLNEAFDDVLGEGAPFPTSMRRTANKFKQMRETSDKQFQGVLSGASQHLTVWEGAAVERITSASDWSPQDFRNSPPTTLYLCVPPNAIETYAPLLRVIIGQHVRELMKEEPDRNAPPILFMLDELPRLGNMAPIREALEVGRSYGIKLWMFVQYVGQLQEAYGKEIASGMIESCGAQIYMNAGAETAEQLSKNLGTRENVLTGKTEPVVTPQELMGPEWRDDMLVFATGEPPLRLKKVFFHEQVAADNI